MRRHLERNLIVYRGTTSMHQIPSRPRNKTYHKTFYVNSCQVISFMQCVSTLNMSKPLHFSQLLHIQTGIKFLLVSDFRRISNLDGLWTEQPRYHIELSGTSRVSE